MRSLESRPELSDHPAPQRHDMLTPIIEGARQAPFVGRIVGGALEIVGDVVFDRTKKMKDPYDQSILGR